MSDQKILLITASQPLADAVTRTFTPAGIQTTLVPSWHKFPVQNKPMYALALLDLDTLGNPKLPELKNVVSTWKGLPVIALCDFAKTANRETVEFLGAGVNDVIAINTPPPLLAAKVRAHLRRGMDADRAASGWLRN